MLVARVIVTFLYIVTKDLVVSQRVVLECTFARIWVKSKLQVAKSHLLRAGFLVQVAPLKVDDFGLVNLVSL